MTNKKGSDASLLDAAPLANRLGLASEQTMPVDLHTYLDVVNPQIKQKPTNCSVSLSLIITEIQI